MYIYINIFYIYLFIYIYIYIYNNDMNMIRHILIIITHFLPKFNIAIVSMNNSIIMPSFQLCYFLCNDFFSFMEIQL